ncbi:hypothetical protein QBC39DRAFT_375954 [Podospora conica]|nr:hypothetical protein QBC39DRAFT_375954 [Schizothecium conicum]
MLPDAPDIGTLFANLIWRIIDKGDNSVTAYPYHIFLPSQDIVNDFVSELDITFHPDLFGILNSDTPPPVSWFKAFSMVLPPTGVWGVYFLLFEKDDDSDKPILYIGSGTGTGSSAGVRNRLNQHITSSKHAVPTRIAQAYRDGYKLVNLGLLATCAMPSAGLECTAIEAVFTWLFWALDRYDKSFGFPERIIWTSSILPWRGACSHNSLRETKGELFLTDEQLEKGRKYVEARNKQRHAEWVKANPERWKASQLATKERAFALKKHYCDICDLAVHTPAELTRHLLSKRHADVKARGKTGGWPACKICGGPSFANESSFKSHQKGEKHRKNLAAARNTYEQSTDEPNTAEPNTAEQSTTAKNTATNKTTWLDNYLAQNTTAKSTAAPNTAPKKKTWLDNYLAKHAQDKE